MTLSETHAATLQAGVCIRFRPNRTVNCRVPNTWPNTPRNSSLTTSHGQPFPLHIGKTPSQSLSGFVVQAGHASSILVTRSTAKALAGGLLRTAELAAIEETAQVWSGPAARVVAGLVPNHRLGDLVGAVRHCTCHNPIPRSINARRKATLPSRLMLPSRRRRRSRAAGCPATGSTARTAYPATTWPSRLPRRRS